MDSILRFGRMLPPHDLSRELDQVRQRMEEVRTQMGRYRDSQAPGHLTLGEGYLILSQPEQARKELETAWNSGYRPAEVSLALGNCFIDLYNKAYPETLTILDEKTRTERQTQLQKEFLNPALINLKRAKQELGSLPRMEEIRFALAEERLDDATALARAVYKAEPWRSEALVDLAASLSLKGREVFDAGQLREAKKYYEMALDALDQPQRTDPSDERIFGTLNIIWFNGRFLKLRGADIRTSLERSLETGEYALSLNHPPTGILATRIAFALIKIGDEAGLPGENPEPWFSRAETKLLGVLEKGVDAPFATVRADAYNYMIYLTWTRAIRAQAQKKEYLPFLQKGLHFFQMAEAEGQVIWSTYEGVAGLYDYLADYQKDRQEDCGPALEHCVEVMTKAVDLNPIPRTLDNLARCLDDLAGWRVEHGQDPESCLKKAHEALRRSAEQSPGLSLTFDSLGNTYLLEARWAHRQGQDPFPILEKARVAYENTAEADRHEKGAYYGMESLYLFGLTKLQILAAEVRLSRHEDPTPDARKALDYSRKALAAKPSPDMVEEIRQAMAKARKLMRSPR
jgi:eukaryotic-like serine/threonine-protein kinase